jgi:hypothetical protein
MPTASFMELHRAEKSIRKVIDKLDRADQIRVLGAVLALLDLAVVEKDTGVHSLRGSSDAHNTRERA